MSRRPRNRRNPFNRRRSGITPIQDRPISSQSLKALIEEVNAELTETNHELQTALNQAAQDYASMMRELGEILGYSPLREHALLHGDPDPFLVDVVPKLDYDPQDLYERLTSPKVHHGFQERDTIDALLGLHKAMEQGLIPNEVPVVDYLQDKQGPTTAQRSFINNVINTDTSDQLLGVGVGTTYDATASSLWYDTMKAVKGYLKHDDDAQYSAMDDTESKILHANKNTIFTNALIPYGSIIELGSGDGKKFRHFAETYNFMDLSIVDSSPAFLAVAAKELQQSTKLRYKNLTARIADFETDEGKDIIESIAKGKSGPKVIRLMGRTIGNIDRTDFIQWAYDDLLNPGDTLMVGFQLTEDPKAIEARYQGEGDFIGEALVNMLPRKFELEDELQADFAQNLFKKHFQGTYEARFNYANQSLEATFTVNEGFNVYYQVDSNGNLMDVYVRDLDNIPRLPEGFEEKVHYFNPGDKIKTAKSARLWSLEQDPELLKKCDINLSDYLSGIDNNLKPMEEEFSRDDIELNFLTDPENPYTVVMVATKKGSPYMI